MQPLLLAIETSTRTARVALVAKDGRVASQAQLTADRHAAHLLEMCDRLFKASGTTPAQLAGIACGAGPGSFTGLRVGMSLGKGLAMPFGTPFMLQSSLHTLAYDVVSESRAPAGQSVVACVDAGKGEIHAQMFSSDGAAVKAIDEPWRLTPSALAERLDSRSQAVWAVGGPDLSKFPSLNAETLPERVVYLPDVPGPSAAHLGRLAWAALLHGEAVDLGRAAPTYGRGPDITTPKRKTVGDGGAS